MRLTHRSRSTGRHSREDFENGAVRRRMRGCVDALRALEDRTGPAGFRLPDAPGVAARACSTADLHDGAVVDVLAFQDATLRAGFKPPPRRPRRSVGETRCTGFFVRIAMIIGPGRRGRAAGRTARLHLDAGVDLVLASAPRPDRCRTRGLRDVRTCWIRRPDGADEHRGRRAAPRPSRPPNTPPTGSYVSGPTTEFWWPRASTIGDVLVAVPPRYGVVQALRSRVRSATRRRVVRRPHDGLATPSPRRRPVTAPSSTDFARSGVSRRAVACTVVRRSAPGTRSRFCVIRRRKHFSPRPTRRWQRRWRRAPSSSTSGSGMLSRALRERSSYRLPTGNGISLGLEAPTVVDDALYAVECAAVGEVNLDRLDRRITGPRSEARRARVSLLAAVAAVRVVRLVGGRRRRRG